MEDWHAIKTLKKRNPSISARAIARSMRISHHTVQRALIRDDPPAYDRTAKINCALEPFRDLISELANAKRFRGSRILNELRSKGYTGGKTAFYQLLAEVKVETRKHFTPYSTAPGEQSQFDWSPYSVPIAGVATKVIVFSYLNSFSRFPVYEGSLSEDRDTVFWAIEQGVIESGGVPQRMQTDNAKVFVDDASVAHFRWNPDYLSFCAHYGITPSRSLPRHPWSKGKVEKPFQFIEDHFIKGASFESFEDFLLKLKAFQHEVAARVHATTKATPQERLNEDRAAFAPLPASRYCGARPVIRSVSRDCLLSFDASRYSVPWQYAGVTVWLRLVRGHTLEIYSHANALIATHARATVKGSLVIDKRHYRTAETPHSSIDRIRLRFRETYPDQDVFLDALLEQKRTNARHHLAGILDVARHYHPDDVARAFESAMTYKIYTVTFIAGYLEKNFQHVFDLASVRGSTVDPLPTDTITRDLRDYRLEVSS
jgi:transposase